MRTEEPLPNYHEDHIARRGDNSPQQCNLVHKLLPMPQAMKIPAAEAAVDKEWGRLEKIPAWNVTKSETNPRWSMKQGPRAQKFILHHWWTSVIWRMPNWRQSTKNIKVELYSEATLWKMILDLMQYLQNKDLQHLKWQPPRSWISSPDCQGAQDKQLTQYLLTPKWKWKMLTNCSFSKIGVSRHLDSSTTTQVAKIMVQYGRSSRTSWAKSVWSSFDRTALRKAIWENLVETRFGESSKLGMSLRTPFKKGYSYLCMWMTSKWLERKYASDVESTKQGSWFGRTNIIPWPCVLGMHSKTM